MKLHSYFLLVVSLLTNSAHAINFESAPAKKTYKVQIAKSNLDDSYAGGSFFGLDGSGVLRIGFFVVNQDPSGYTKNWLYSVYDQVGAVVYTSSPFEFSENDYQKMSYVLRSISEKKCAVSVEIAQATNEILILKQKCPQNK